MEGRQEDVYSGAYIYPEFRKSFQGVLCCECAHCPHPVDLLDGEDVARLPATRGVLSLQVDGDGEALAAEEDVGGAALVELGEASDLLKAVELVENGVLVGAVLGGDVGGLGDALVDIC